MAFPYYTKKSPLREILFAFEGNKNAKTNLPFYFCLSKVKKQAKRIGLPAQVGWFSHWKDYTWLIRNLSILMED
jgi:hypothetical protein